MPSPRRHPWPSRRTCFVALLVLAALIPRAEAQETPDCDSISGGAPIVYGAGGSAQRPLIGRAAVVLQNADAPVHVVYKDDAGACSGIDALAGLGATELTGTARYWDTATGAQLTCALPVEGQAVDFASMGNGPLLCPLVTDLTLVEGIVDVTGPVSTVNVIVPVGSTQQAISAEALYLVYGFNAEADVAPWNNASEAYYIARNANSYVQQYLATATGLPASAFLGVDAGTNSNTIALLGALADPEQGIGFTSGEVADASRDVVRTLAYQHTGQNAAVWPDSDATSFDKVNVRNGTYFLWGPGHFYALEGATPGSFANPAAGVLVDYLSGAAHPAGASETITEIAVANQNIPRCAMEVWRDGDLTPVYASAPAEPCSCWFELQATGATSCATCDASTPCATGTCRDGVCEAT